MEWCLLFGSCYGEDITMKNIKVNTCPKEEDGLDSLWVSGGPRHIDYKIQCWCIISPFKMLCENRNNEEQCEKMNSCGSRPIVKKSKMVTQTCLGGTSGGLDNSRSWSVSGEAKGSWGLVLGMLALWKTEPSWNCVRAGVLDSFSLRGPHQPRGFLQRSKSNFRTV